MGGVQSTEQTAEGEWQEGVDEQLTRRGTETTPPKVTASAEEVGDCLPVPKEPFIQPSEEEIAEIEAVAKELLETRGGKALDITLSPALNKPRSRVSPPTSPTPPTLASIDQKLREAEERKKNIETQRIMNLETQLAKIDIAQQKKEESERAKAEEILRANEARLQAADEKKARGLFNVRVKVSEHMHKIEMAQERLEASLEAARIAAEASIYEKREKSVEMKNLQMEDMLRKIKDHQEHVKEVRSNQENMLRPHVEKVQASIREKEERAREILVRKETEQREKQAEQTRRAEVARKNRKRLAREARVQDALLTSEMAISNFNVGR